MREMLSGFENEKPRRKKFRKIFICPIKNEKFQAIISLSENAYYQITSVEVGKIND